MDAQQYEKLRKNHVRLCCDVDAKSILPYLIQDGVIDADMKREILNNPGHRSQMEKLLAIMRKLPPDRKAFEAFIRALRSTGLSDYEEFAETIERTSTVSDASVRSKVDASHCKDKVNRVLRENFANFENEEISIDEVKQVLVEKSAFTHTTWSNKMIAEYVCDVAFVGVEKMKKKLRPNSSTVFFKNLGRIKSSDETDSHQAEALPTGNVCDIQSLQTQDLIKYLSSKFEERNLSTAPLDELAQQNIDGQVFVTLSEEDMKEVMPSATFGHRRHLDLLIREQKEKVTKANRYVHLRAFDKDVKATDYYTSGTLVDTKINARGKKTTPLKNFHLPEFNLQSDMVDYVLKQCIIFAAACINDRQNGTVYFGISPDSRGSQVKGKIVGLQLSPEDFDNDIPSMFFKNKETLIKKCVRSIKAIPVIESGSEKSFVLELDVVPGTLLSEEERVRINASKMACLFKECKVKDPIYIFSEAGIPRLMHPSETDGSTKIPSCVIEQRKNDELEKVTCKKPSLMQLRNCLTGGSDKYNNDLYIFLLLSPFHESDLDTANMEFIKHLQPHVVFDFDSNKESTNTVFSSLENMEVVTRAVTLDDFDERQKEKKDIKAFENELIDSDFTNWVFCNGYGRMAEMEVIDWNRKRSHAFQAAFTHYISRFEQKRILIILCLFTSQYRVILDACDVVLRLFPEQWILLSETPTIAECWQKTFKGRDKVNAKDLRDRCIIGLSWEQINNGITTFCGQKETRECKIVDSSGCHVKVECKKIDEWSDVEVVSALNPIDESGEEENAKRKEAAEEEFYRGNQVSWLNFYAGHACRRQIHQSLQDIVEDALEGKHCENERIMTTYLYHEPGAGGSTSARHILWSLRQKYRCCVIRELNNPSQTADQLTSIFLFKDPSPKPILVLLDNEDEDKVFQLRVNLEKKARDYDDRFTGVFCVLLICSRMFDVPIPKRNFSMVVLKQSLDEEDKIWFEQRYTTLIERYKNPKTLISFNILKENFNKHYIKNTVKEFLGEITNAEEERILKIVSFINCFDLEFKFIHVSCFDTILKSGPVFRFDFSQARRTCWEANVSQSFKVLLNLNSRDDARKMKRIRLFTKLTAEHVLNCLREKSGESVSDILYSLLNDNIFSATDVEMKKFKNVISNIVKKRAFKEGGLKKEKFSPLVLYIKEHENNDIAGCAMETLFELNSDPFTAQQVSRFYIECKNYTKAENYAKEATAILPKNSYMWDTYAQVFNDQLHDLFQSKCQIVDGEFSDEDLKQIIGICQRCTELFRKEQMVSQEEALVSNTEINNAGYFGELRSILIMLSSIEKCHCFESKETVHKFLVDNQYTNDRLNFLSKIEQDYLKSLWYNSKEALRILGDEFLQTKIEFQVNPLTSYEQPRRMLLQLHVSLNEFFGESCSVPPNLNENEMCLHRSRQVFSKRCHTLHDALQLKSNKDFDVLNECYNLILQNVRSEHSNVDDGKILLNIVTVLLTETSKVSDCEFQFNDIIQWSKDLYQRAIKQGYPYLEPFLYFTLYNFPTKERLEYPNLARPEDLTKVLTQWRDSFDKKNNLQRITRRETTLFFLGNGKPLTDIVYQKYLDKLMQGKDNVDKWHLPQVCRHLRLMSGILSDCGHYIDYHYKSKQGNQNWIRIKAANRIKTKSWLQKRVYFYLGFSFSGLKCYGITNTNTTNCETGNPPNTESSLSSSNSKQPDGRLKREQQPLNLMSFRRLEERRQKLTHEIKKLKRQGKPTEALQRKLDGINAIRQEIIGS